MLRRSNRVSRPPCRFDASVPYNQTFRRFSAAPAFPLPTGPVQLIHPKLLPNLDPDPPTYREAITSSDGDLWEDCGALVKRNTWTLVLPVGRKAVRCKWVFRRTLNPDGTSPATRPATALISNMALI